MSQDNTILLEKIKDVHPIDDTKTFNSAMIEVSIPITKFGALINSKRWICMYTESGLMNGIHGTYMDRELGCVFSFTATFRWIHLIPTANYKPQGLVDFFLWISKVISKDAQLMTYNEYQEKHKDDLR